jgi:hypothetical protein
MKKQTVIGLPAQILGITLLLPGLLSPGRALAQPISGTSASPQEMGTAHQDMGQSHPAKARSTSLTVTVAGKTQTFSPADLTALPHETVSVMNAHLKKTGNYSGVPLAAILDTMGLPFVKANEHTLLHSYWVAEGTDGYQVVVSPMRRCLRCTWTRCCSRTAATASRSRQTML